VAVRDIQSLHAKMGNYTPFSGKPRPQTQMIEIDEGTIEDVQHLNSVNIPMTSAIVFDHLEKYPTKNNVYNGALDVKRKSQTAANICLHDYSHFRPFTFCCVIGQRMLSMFS
jgi:hypothetical protein